MDREGELRAPNGLEMSRPASQGQVSRQTQHPAGRVGSIELLGRHLCLARMLEGLEDHKPKNDGPSTDANERDEVRPA